MRRIAYSFFALWMLLIMTVLSGCGSKGLVISETDTQVKESAETSASGDTQADADRIYVYLTGAVENPGVYAMHEGDRVFDVIEKAGGFTDDADQTDVNLAQILEDEQQINIPTQLESQEKAAAEEEAGLVNINTATLEELCTLTGIGEAKAQSIITYREENGDFSSVEEIMNISGIKEGVYEKIKDQITVG